MTEAAQFLMDLAYKLRRVPSELIDQRDIDALFALSAHLSQEDGSQDLGAHPRGSGPGPSSLEEFARAKAVITEANNSLFGSQGYFLSLNGGPADKHHLSRPIEELKRSTRQNWQMAEALKPLAKLKVPFKPVGNAGAYSILFDDIRRAQQALENSKAALADATNNPVPLPLSDAGSDAEGRG
jgi:hypothetical protein